MQFHNYVDMHMITYIVVNTVDDVKFVYSWTAGVCWILVG